jgi:protein-tyrosine phosphatase
MMTAKKPNNFERCLPFQGAQNFRDYGGYATLDGRQVKWRQLFRSGQLSTLTADDIRYFESLDIRLVLDLRRDQERDSDPSLFPVTAMPKVIGLSISPGSSANLFDGMIKGDMSREDMVGCMRAINRELALEQAQTYRQMFRHLLNQQQGASLVHCAAGKDRTGFAAAMILAALGVSRETILQDYMLTASYFSVDAEIERISRKYQWPGDINSMRPLLEVREDYLQSAFAAIDEEFASLDNYLCEALGVGESERAYLRDRYLD